MAARLPVGRMMLCGQDWLRNVLYPDSGTMLFMSSLFINEEAELVDALSKVTYSLSGAAV